MGILLSAALEAWGTTDFDQAFKREIESQNIEVIPLQAELSSSSHVYGEKFSVMVLRKKEHPARLEVKTGFFFNGVVAGCNCADDPSPIEPQPEYTELSVFIDKTTGECAFE